MGSPWNFPHHPTQLVLSLILIVIVIIWGNDNVVLTSSLPQDKVNVNVKNEGKELGLELRVGAGSGAGYLNKTETRLTNIAVTLYLHTGIQGQTIITTSSTPPAQYTYKLTLGNGWTYPATGTCPLYQYLVTSAGTITTYLYTTTWGDSGSQPYNFLGITAYVWCTPVDSSLPVYRFYSSTQKDHWYSRDLRSIYAGDGQTYLLESIIMYLNQP